MTIPLVSTNVGNGFSKAVATTERSCVFRSVGALEQGALNFSSELDQSERDDLTDGRKTGLFIEFRGERWALGQAAYDNGRMQVNDMSRSRIEESSYLLLYAATLAATVRNSGLLAVVASLPIRWYTSDRDKARSVLSGEFTVRYAGKTRTYTVLPERCNIIPEGFGALCARVLTSTGKIADPEMARARVGVVDIGTRTVGFLRVDSLKVIPAESDMTDKLGMSTVWKLLEERISDLYGRELKAPELDQALSEGRFRDAGKWVDIQDEAARAAESLAKAIESTINSMWDSGRGVDVLYFTGGGARYVVPFLPYKNIECSEAGYFDNAEGGLRFGIARGFANE